MIPCNYLKFLDKEIDFIIEKKGEIKYIQVCYKIEEEKTLEREKDSLLKIKDNWEKYIIVFDKYISGNIEGIKVINFMDIFDRF